MNAMKQKDRSMACSLMKEHVLNALDVLRDMSDQGSETPAGLIPGKVVSASE